MLVRHPHLESAGTKYIKKGDTRGTEHIGKWSAQTRPGGLLVGLIQMVASPAGFEPAFWP